jgi:hypothetical protein
VKLSIALATYNGADFLPEQLESYLRQTRPPDELVISDDASVDDTFAICSRFAEDAPFDVTLSRNETNLGVVANFDKAIRACTGDVIATSDQDDVWYPHKLAVLTTALEANPGAGLAFSDADIVDETLQSTGTRLWNEAGFDSRRQEAVRQGRGFEELFLGSNFVTGAAMAFRSELRQWCLPVATDVRDLIHDGWIALVAAAVSDIVPVGEPLISYRLHEAQAVGLGNPPNLERPKLPFLLFEPVDFGTELRELTTIRDALRSLPLPPPAEPRLRQLEHMIGHWARRSRLPASAARRAVVVAKELANRRYFAYSRGFRSAGKDLFFAPDATAGRTGSDGGERVGSERR